MKLTGYYKDNKALTDIAICTKYYNGYIIEERRQLRERIISGIKDCCIEDMRIWEKFALYYFPTHNAFCCRFTNRENWYYYRIAIEK